MEVLMEQQMDGWASKVNLNAPPPTPPSPTLKVGGIKTC